MSGDGKISGKGPESTKYPKHAVMAKKSNKDTRYSGAGPLHDRVTKQVTTARDGTIPTRGKEGSVLAMNKLATVHNHMGHNLSEDDGYPAGRTPKRMFTKEHDGCNHVVPHGFRAHPKNPNVTKDYNTNTLRFSGNEAAHQVGKRHKSFGMSNYRTAGLGMEMAPHTKPLLPDEKTSRKQHGNIKQPKQGTGSKNFPGIRSSGK